MVQERLGPASPETINIETLFPRNQPRALLDNSFYVDIITNQPGLKLQKELTKAVHAVEARNFKKNSEIVKDGLFKSDVIDAHKRSTSSSILRARLSDKNNRMPRDAFIAWMRFFLAIPQLARLGNAKPCAQLGYDAEECWHPHLSEHFRRVDVHGNHANSNYHSSIQARSDRHSFLKWAVYRAAQEAACKVNDEPSTYHLLLKQFKPEECRALFPKVPSKAIQKEIDGLMKDLDDLSQIRDGPERRAKRLAISNRCKLMHRQHKTTGLRLDLEIVDTYNNEFRWIDVTSVHPTCKTRIKREFIGIYKQIESAKVARQDQTEDPLADKSGRTVTDQAALKFDHYAPLLAVAKKQCEAKRRASMPTFSPAIVTTYGEVSKQTIHLREWLAMRYGQRLQREGEFDDGVKISTKTAIFRNNFKTNIQVAVARGMA